MYIYTLVLDTESGDTYVWSFGGSPPSKAEIERIFQRDIPEEVEAGTTSDANWTVYTSILE